MKTIWWIVIFVVALIAFIASLILYLSVKRSLPAGSSQPTVISWQPETGKLTIQTNKKKETLELVPPKTVIIIPVNLPNEPKDERLVMMKNSSWWQTAFCPKDTVEITDNGKKIRNTGVRACR